MAATARSDLPSSLHAPLITLISAPQPVKVTLRYEDSKASAACYRTLHTSNSTQSPLPLWKRCLCCCCLLYVELQEIEASIDELETKLLEAGVPISTILYE